MSRRWPLRSRLVAVVLVSLAAVGAVIGVVSALALRGSLMDQLDSELVETSHRAGVERTGPTPGFSDDVPGLDTPGQGVGTVVLVHGGPEPLGGHITAAGAIDQLTTAEARALMAVPEDGTIRTAEVGSLGRYRVLAAADRDGLVWVTGLSLAEVDATVGRHVLTTLLVTLVGVGVVGVAGSLLIRRELRQLDRVAATAVRVAQLPLSHGEVQLADRVPEEDTDPVTEVGKVGAALNQLLGHVESALGARQASEVKLRRFVADASHELRTPLASIRGYAELARRIPEDVPPDVVRALGRVESEAVRMTQLVEDLLLLARLDAGRPLEQTPVDLTGLAADAVADAHAAGPDHVWRLVLPGRGNDDGAHDGAAAGDGAAGAGQGYDDRDAPADVLVTGDEHALRQVLANLLTNARVHTPDGTTVTTTVKARDGVAVLTVQDTGPGIAPDLVGRLSDRFSRGDAARSPGAGSTGLGLSIADAVVGAHGGRIDVDGTPGATTFTVTFPPAQVPLPPGPPPPPPDAAEAADAGSADRTQPGPVPG